MLVRVLVQPHFVCDSVNSATPLDVNIDHQTNRIGNCTTVDIHAHLENLQLRLFECPHGEIHICDASTALLALHFAFCIIGTDSPK